MIKTTEKASVLPLSENKSIPKNPFKMPYDLRTLLYFLKIHWCRRPKSEDSYSQDIISIKR